MKPRMEEAMKQTCDLPAPTMLSGRIPWLSKEISLYGYWAGLREKISDRMGEPTDLLKTGAATLLISCLFLAGSYIFLTQLAKYGW